MKKKSPFHCYFCGGPVARVADGCIEIGDQERGQPLSKEYVRFNRMGGREVFGYIGYPGNGAELVERGQWRDYERVAYFSHYSCPEFGSYWIPLDRLDEDWESHLSHKNWYAGPAFELLREARSHFGIERVPRAGEEDA